MRELLFLAVGIGLLGIAVFKAGASNVAWLVFRIRLNRRLARLARLATVALALLLLWAALDRLTGSSGAR